MDFAIIKNKQKFYWQYSNLLIPLQILFTILFTGPWKSTFSHYLPQDKSFKEIHTLTGPKPVRFSCRKHKWSSTQMWWANCQSGGLYTLVYILQDKPTQARPLLQVNPLKTLNFERRLLLCPRLRDSPLMNTCPGTGGSGQGVGNQPGAHWPFLSPLPLPPPHFLTCRHGLGVWLLKSSRTYFTII